MPAKRQAAVPRGWLVVNGTLLLVVLVSATSVIETTHQCRLQYARLQELQSLEWDMLANWRQLLFGRGHLGRPLSGGESGAGTIGDAPAGRRIGAG